MAEAAAQRPSAAYAAGIHAGRWQPDEAQGQALVELDRIHRQLRARQRHPRWKQWLWKLRPPAPVP